MKIPCVINPNTRQAYQSSDSAKELLSEAPRKLCADDLDWKERSVINKLSIICLDMIAKNFEKDPIIDSLIPQDREYLIEKIHTDLPLTFTIPLLEYDKDWFYWKRCYNAKFGEVVKRKVIGMPWKHTYIEHYVRQLIEEAEPQFEHKNEFKEVLDECASYCTRLFITNLMHWQPLLTMLKDERPEKMPEDHIDFKPIFQSLQFLVEVEISYGMRNIGLDYDLHMFKVSLLDMEKLGTALNILPVLQRFKLYKSEIYDEHIKKFVRGFMDNKTVTDLELSYLHIVESGATCIGQLIMTMEQLRKLNLRSNQINGAGVKGIAYALTHSPICTLKRLDLSLNPLGNEGIIPICSALLRCSNPVELNISGCDIDIVTSVKIGSVLKYNNSLRKLNISNNKLGEDGGRSFLMALQLNKIIYNIDISNTEIPVAIEQEMKALLANNFKEYHEQQKIKKYMSSSTNESSLASYASSTQFNNSQMDWISVDYSENQMI